MPTFIPMRPRRPGGSMLPALIFLLGFTVLLVLVCRYFVFPGIQLAQHMDKPGRRKLAASAILALTLMLTLLLVGLWMTFRPGRFFFPRPSAPRVRTKVVDAWAEAGRRLEQKSEPTEEGK